MAATPHRAPRASPNTAASASPRPKRTSSRLIPTAAGSSSVLERPRGASDARVSMSGGDATLRWRNAAGSMEIAEGFGGDYPRRMTRQGTHDFQADPRNDEVLVYVDGALVPRREARV